MTNIEILEKLSAENTSTFIEVQCGATAAKELVGYARANLKESAPHKELQKNYKVFIFKDDKQNHFLFIPYILFQLPMIYSSYKERSSLARFIIRDVVYDPFLDSIPLTQ
jgi:hypothetical protein